VIGWFHSLICVDGKIQSWKHRHQEIKCGDARRRLNTLHPSQSLLTTKKPGSDGVMNFKSISAGIVLLSATLCAAPIAHADTLVPDQWYTFGFENAGDPLVPPFGGGLGINGPLPGGGTGDAIAAPSTWTITLPAGGWIIFTDQEISGDHFQIFVNGAGATPTTNTLTPSGQAGLAGGFTSVDNPNASSVGEDISAALSDSNFSSGTFLLVAGLNTITADFLGTITFGDASFLVGANAVPLPAALPLFATGLGALGLIGWRRKRTRTAAIAA
jgi:hypothetical protein